MIKLRFDQLSDITGGTLLAAEPGESMFAGVSIDSRTLRPGQLFVAIKGEHNDGHQFIDLAVAAGASGLLIQRGCRGGLDLPTSVSAVEVPDSHAAMIKLAASYLSTIDARRVGITGSNGKTTTKEFLCRLLRAVTDHVYGSPGNFNNLFGIPLALFDMPEDTEIAVLEMGISVPGEMSRLAELVKPHLMLVTNVGTTHLEFLGTVQNVAREKLSAMKNAAPGARLIVNADDPILLAEARKLAMPMLTFGHNEKADLRPDRLTIDAAGTVTVTIDGHRFRLPLFGEYQVMNLLAACAAVLELGYDFDSVDTEEIELVTAEMRGERIDIDGITFIADCYNANPESVKAGLASFDRHHDGNRRVVVFGDMLELGEDSRKYHRQVGQSLAAYAFDLIVTVGPLSRDVVAGAVDAGLDRSRLLHFDSAAICAEEMMSTLRAGDIVYLKGSRGVGLEVIITTFRRAGDTA